MDKEQRKAYYRAYNQQPRVKERRRAYRSRPEIKAKDNERVKEYQKRPEVQARQKEYRKAYYQRPEVKAKAAARYKKKKLEKMIALLQAEGYTVQIQHPGNFISTYRCLGQAHKSVGDKVKGGEAIGSTWESTADAGEVELQLWFDGVAVDPENYITF